MNISLEHKKFSFSSKKFVPKARHDSASNISPSAILGFSKAHGVRKKSISDTNKLFETRHFGPHVCFWLISLAYLLDASSYDICPALARQQTAWDKFRARHVPRLDPFSFIKEELVALWYGFEFCGHPTTYKYARSIKEASSELRQRHRQLEIWRFPYVAYSIIFLNGLKNVEVRHAAEYIYVLRVKHYWSGKGPLLIHLFDLCPLVIYHSKPFAAFKGHRCFVWQVSVAETSNSEDLSIEILTLVAIASCTHWTFLHRLISYVPKVDSENIFRSDRCDIRTASSQIHFPVWHKACTEVSQVPFIDTLCVKTCRWPFHLRYV